MKGDRTRLYNFANEFYDLDGSVVMKLSPIAAIDVCRTAAAHGLVIARIEGGMWHNPGFEARYDCIWDGASPPVTLAVAEKNNGEAERFIEQAMENHDAFILTAPPIIGWPNAKNKNKNKGVRDNF